MGMPVADGCAATEAAAMGRSRETVIVAMVIDENRDKKGNVEALNWALKHVVRPRDTVLVLGILREFGKQKSCLSLHTGISFFNIWEKLELTSRNDMTAMEMEEELERKRIEYQSSLQPFCRYCKKSEVKLEVKIAAGYKARDITMEAAKHFNTRWIVLDSHLKKETPFLYGKVKCDMAILKGRDVATLVPPKNRLRTDQPVRHQAHIGICSPQLEHQSVTMSPKSPSRYPLSLRAGYPRVFSLAEIEEITSDFSDENLLRHEQDTKVFLGSWRKTPVLVRCLSSKNQTFQSSLAVLTRVRHRHISNLVGYCFTDTEAYSLCDYPSMGTLESNLASNEAARNLPWNTRWNIALGIGSSLRYLQEDCADGPAVHLSVISANVLFYNDWSPMLGNFATANWLKDKFPSADEQLAACLSSDADQQIATDIHDYGIILLELISGKSAKNYDIQNLSQTFEDWALEHLENESFYEMMDPRIEDTDDTGMVDRMAHASLLCLRNTHEQRVSMSKVLAMLRTGNLEL